MFTHIMVGCSDPGRGKAFYDALFTALGGTAGFDTGKGAFYRHNGGAFGITIPANGEPVTYANGGTIGFAATSIDMVQAWHAAGLGAGGTDEGAPGERSMPGRKLYGAYLRDPDGNKICAFVDLTEAA
jgi:catechol 2,3-dioxygenase-like lactoylglutathione lyase family enzyme